MAARATRASRRGGVGWGNATFMGTPGGSPASGPAPRRSPDFDGVLVRPGARSGHLRYAFPSGLSSPPDFAAAGPYRVPPDARAPDGARASVRGQGQLAVTRGSDGC